MRTYMRPHGHRYPSFRSATPEPTAEVEDENAQDAEPMPEEASTLTPEVEELLRREDEAKDNLEAAVAHYLFEAGRTTRFFCLDSINDTRQPGEVVPDLSDAVIKAGAANIARRHAFAVTCFVEHLMQDAIYSRAFPASTDEGLTSVSPFQSRRGRRTLAYGGGRR